MIFRALGVLGVVCGVATASVAADIETDMTEPMREMGCTVRLTGEIAEGDLDRLRSVLQQNFGEGILPDHPDFREIVFRNLSPAVDYGDFFFTHRLCLNSPGGSVAEAKNIVQYMRADARAALGGVPTAVARGDRCEGACALVFLAGRFLRFENTPAYENRSNALLHPEGVLGLQAPLPVRPEGIVDDSQLTAWVQGAADSVAWLTQAVAEKTLFLTSDGVAQMIGAVAPGMARVETVGDAVRWGIEVEPTQLSFGGYDPDRETFLNAVCRNAALGLGDAADLEAGPESMTFEAAGEDHVGTTGGFVDALSGRVYSCLVETFSWQDFSSLMDMRAGEGNPHTRGLELTRLRYAGTAPRVIFRAVDPCQDCDLMAELPDIAAYPPDTPLAVLSPPVN